MTHTTVVCLTAIILVLPSLSWAQKSDINQTVLLLPDPEAECRYVQSLLDTATAALSGSQRLRDEGEALAAAGNMERAASKMIAAGMTANGLTKDKMLEVTAATQAINIKRGTLPPCAIALHEQGQKGVRDAIMLATECAARSQVFTRQATGR